MQEAKYPEFAYNVQMQKLDKDTLLCVKTQKATKKNLRAGFEPAN